MSVEQWTQRRWSHVDGDSRRDIICEKSPGKFEIIDAWTAKSEEDLKKLQATLSQVLTDLASERQAERIIDSALA